MGNFMYCVQEEKEKRTKKLGVTTQKVTGEWIVRITVWQALFRHTHPPKGKVFKAIKLA